MHELGHNLNLNHGGGDGINYKTCSQSGVTYICQFYVDAFPWTGYDDWNVGVRLSVPLFDGDIRKRRVDQAALEQRQVNLQRDDARNRIASEVEQAFGGLAEARARLTHATQGEVEAREALRIETLRYHNGESTITDLLGAESALWAAAANRLQAGYDITASQARLLRAMGELGPESFGSAAAGDRLAQYLAWHRCGLGCGETDEVVTASAVASSSPRHTAGNHPGHPLQQGARL